MRKSAVFFLSCFLTFLGISVSLLTAEKKMENPGRRIFEKNCLGCHGKNGKGNPAIAKVFKVQSSALDLTFKEIIKKSDEEILKVITEGKGKMPAFPKKLTESEQQSLLRYVRTFDVATQKTKVQKQGRTRKRKRERRRLGEVLTVGKEVYLAKCASCHGKSGKGNPGLAKGLKIEASLLDMTREETTNKSDEDLLLIISKGKNKMPGYSNKISQDKQILSLKYIRYLASE